MNSKNLRNQTAKQASFRVKISKSQGEAVTDLKSLDSSSRSRQRKRTKYATRSKRTTTFITKIPNMKIPSPPKSLLERIEEEKRKIIKCGFNESINLWEFPLLWDNDDLLISITNNILNNLYSKSASRVVSRRPLNSFMAFRVYNAQFGYGLRQNILSSLLASAWHSHPEQQNVWDTFAQQFNFVKPKCGFVEWVDQRYERES